MESTYPKARIPRHVHRAMKTLCAATGQEIQDFAGIAIIQYLAQAYHRRPALKPTNPGPVDALGFPLCKGDQVAHLETPLQELGTIYQPRFPSGKVGVLSGDNFKQSYNPGKLVRLQEAPAQSTQVPEAA